MMEKIDALILAGGLGTRLRSIMPDRPKVLAPVGERLFLSYILEQLIESGIQHAVLCTGYLGDRVQVSFGDHYGSMSLAYSRESMPLGTAGAIRFAESLLESNPVLVMNGDSYCQADLDKFCQWHIEKHSKATLLLAHVLDTKRYGQVKTDQNGALVRFVEKDGGHGPGWINAGVYLLDRDLVAAIPSGRAVSLEKEIFPDWIGRNIYGYQSEGRFLDIGIPEDYERAESFFQDKAGEQAIR